MPPTGDLSITTTTPEPEPEQDRREPASVLKTEVRRSALWARGRCLMKFWRKKEYFTTADPQINISKNLILRCSSNGLLWSFLYIWASSEVVT